MEDSSEQKNAMTGVVSVTFRDSDDFNALCCRLAGYNSERFRAVALRFYAGEETIITIYAQDKGKKVTNGEDHLPVHKFKVEISFEKFFNEIRQMNFTISDHQFKLPEMEVINK